MNDAILVIKASEFQKVLNIENFKSIVGWLDKFKRRYAIRKKIISGKSVSVDELVAENTLSSIL